ncbi:MAG TPA: YdeI/OmpD-associated family protein [Candidatus Paceibacterota bacterium]
MISKTIKTGVVHRVPADLKDRLLSKQNVLDIWNGLTPLARNEWICYITIVKKAETRKEHLDRMCQDLLKGEKRPCCWPGCPHRRESARKWFA